MRAIQTNRKVTTGFRLLDKYTGGWVLPSLVLLSGDSGVGLTSLALTFSRMFMRGSEKELGVLYLSLKLDKKTLWDRFLSILSIIPIDQIREGKLDEDDQKCLDKAILESCDYKFHIEDRKYPSTSDVIQKIRDVCSRNPIGMVVIDYLQIAAYDDIKSSRAFEEIAKELKIVVIILLKKSEEFDPTCYLPTKVFDPAYGSLISRSDLILFLQDLEFEDPEKVARSQLFPQSLLISKNRFGPNKNLNVVFFRNTLNYGDPNRHDEI